ncbi:MAG: VOC family protein [Steroidobacteraceae bacterium]
MSNLEFWHHHVGVSVPDIEASIAWYDRVLGFKVVRRLRIEAIPANIAILRHAAMHVELFQADNGKPLPADRLEPDSDARTHGNKHISFAVDDVPHFAEELQRRGADIVWMKKHANGANMFIRDNAGNLIEFLQAPREQNFVAELD